MLSMILKKSLKIKGKVGEGASVLISESLGMGKFIQVVNIGGKYLILGITNDRINLLSEVTDPKEIERYEIIQNEKKIQQGKGFIDVISDFIKTKFKQNPIQKKFDYEVDSIDFLKKQRKRVDDMNNK